MSLAEKLKKCFEEGTRNDERHQGLKKTKPNKQKALEHLAKAKHNLRALIVFHDVGFSDWSASAAFYALYQGLLAILAQQGYESKNQSCTFALIEKFIEERTCTLLTKKDVKYIFDKDVTKNLEESEKLLDIREQMQYETKTKLAEAEFQMLKEQTKEIFDRISQEIESNLT